MWSSPHSNRAPNTARLPLDMQAFPTASPSKASRRTAMVSPDIGNGTETNKVNKEVKGLKRIARTDWCQIVTVLVFKSKDVMSVNPSFQKGSFCREITRARVITPFGLIDPCPDWKSAAASPFQTNGTENDSVTLERIDSRTRVNLCVMPFKRTKYSTVPFGLCKSYTASMLTSAPVCSWWVLVGLRL